VDEGKVYDVNLTQLRSIPFGVLPGAYAVLGTLTYSAASLSTDWAYALGVVAALNLWLTHWMYKQFRRYYNYNEFKNLIKELENKGTFPDETCLTKYGEDDDETPTQH
jgi:hypothetical protein